MSPTRRSFIKTGTISLAALGLGPISAFPSAPDASQELKNLVTGIEPLTPEDYALRREKAGGSWPRTASTPCSSAAARISSTSPRSAGG